MEPNKEAALKNNQGSPQMTEPELKQKVSGLMDSQRLAALASEEGGSPYLNLVAFAASFDLKEIYFLTPRKTRKYANLGRNPRAAVMVDNRTDISADLGRGMAVTAQGRVRELTTSPVIE